MGNKGGANRIRTDSRHEGQDYRCGPTRGPRAPRTRTDHAHDSPRHVHRVPRGSANSLGTRTENHHKSTERLLRSCNKRHYAEAGKNSRGGPEGQPGLGSRRYSYRGKLRPVRSYAKPDSRASLLGLGIRPLVTCTTVIATECCGRDTEAEGTLA